MPSESPNTVALTVPPIDPLHEALLTAAAVAAEVKRLLALLKAVEWGATGISGVRCCPECGGYDPGAKDSPTWHAGYHTNREGHASFCDLGNAVNGK
jgi:hypothetical protein